MMHKMRRTRSPTIPTTPLIIPSIRRRCISDSFSRLGIDGLMWLIRVGKEYLSDKYLVIVHEPPSKHDSCMTMILDNHFP